MSELQPPAPPSPGPPVRPQPAAPQPPRDLLTSGMLEALQNTKPWVNLLAILGYIGAGLLGLGGLGMFLLGLIQQFANGGGGMTFGLGILYLFLTIPYALGAQKLKQYGNDIGAALVARAKSTAVEKALRAQQAFWKFAGITVIVLLCFYVIAIPLALLFTIASSMAPQRAQRSTESSSSPLGSLFTTTADKQKQTMADMRRIATAVEARATDTNEYVYGLGPVSQIASSLEPIYIKNMPRNDAWGNPFIYQSASCSGGGRCSEYYLASGGRNGKLERFSPEDYKSSGGAQKTESPDDDIVFYNGSFLRYPAALDPANQN